MEILVAKDMSNSEENEIFPISCTVRGSGVKLLKLGGNFIFSGIELTIPGFKMQTKQNFEVFGFLECKNSAIQREESVLDTNDIWLSKIPSSIRHLKDSNFLN